MSRSTEARKLLVEQEDAAVQELRRLAPEAFAEYMRIRNAINQLDSTLEFGPYVGFAEPMKAVDHWLNEHHVAAPKDDIAFEIAQGGYRFREERTVEGVKKLVQDSMRNQLLTRRYREMNGKLGHFNWPDERFT